jgi:type III restriction enzyme
MTQVVIENPIINSPFDEPSRHFRFTDEGITNDVVEGRRTSSAHCQAEDEGRETA